MIAHESYDEDHQRTSDDSIHALRLRMAKQHNLQTLAYSGDSSLMRLETHLRQDMQLG